MVLLPLPLSPTSATISPGRMARSTSSDSVEESARKEAAEAENAFVSPTVSSSGASDSIRRYRWQRTFVSRLLVERRPRAYGSGP